METVVQYYVPKIQGNNQGYRVQLRSMVNFFLFCTLEDNFSNLKITYFGMPYHSTYLLEILNSSSGSFPVGFSSV